MAEFEPNPVTEEYGEVRQTVQLWRDVRMYRAIIGTLTATSRSLNINQIGTVLLHLDRTTEPTNNWADDPYFMSHTVSNVLDIMRAEGIVNDVTTPTNKSETYYQLSSVARNTVEEITVRERLAALKSSK